MTSSPTGSPRARFERAVFWRLLLIAAVIAAVVALRAIHRARRIRREAHRARPRPLVAGAPPAVSTGVRQEGRRGRRRRIADDLESDRIAGARFERAVFWRLLLIAGVIAAVVALRAIYG